MAFNAPTYIPWKNPDAGQNAGNPETPRGQVDQYVQQLAVTHPEIQRALQSGDLDALSQLGIATQQLRIVNGHLVSLPMSTLDKILMYSGLGAVGAFGVAPAIAGAFGSGAGAAGAAATGYNAPGSVVAADGLTTGPTLAQAGKHAITPALQHLADAAPLIGGVAGRLAGGGGGSLPPNVSPDLQALLAEAMRRMSYQQPLFNAATNQAFAGLPNYAKQGQTPPGGK